MVAFGIDNLLEHKLSDFALRSELNTLENKLNRLIEENHRFKEDAVESKREIYNVKDLARLMALEVSTVRKNYIASGKIMATKGSKGWEIPREEYMRVMEIVNNYGTSWL